MILTRFVLERMLYRFSVSGYRDRFILKGALLLAVLAGDLFRPTRDLDLLGYGVTSPDALAKIFCEICAESVTDDGVTFNAEVNRRPLETRALWRLLDLVHVKGVIVSRATAIYVAEAASFDSLSAAGASAGATAMSHSEGSNYYKI